MKCFCENEMTIRQIQKKEFLECPFCGYLRKISIPSKEEEKARYDNHVCDQSYQEYMYTVFLKIRPFLAGRCLDYGCGQIHALADILANEKYDSKYYDLYYYPEEPKGSFDTIILIEVFEHILDVDGLIRNLSKMLNETGKIIIMTSIKKEPLESWWYLRDITHVSFVSLKTMELLAKKNELKLTLEDGFFVFEKKEIYL